jgi:hypothetical protein
MYATEELEQSAHLALMLRGADPNTLNAEQITDLDRHFLSW